MPSVHTRGQQQWKVVKGRGTPGPGSGGGSVATSDDWDHYPPVGNPSSSYVLPYGILYPAWSVCYWSGRNSDGNQSRCQPFPL